MSMNHLEPVPRPAKDELGVPVLYYMITDTSARVRPLAPDDQGDLERVFRGRRCIEVVRQRVQKDRCRDRQVAQANETRTAGVSARVATREIQIQLQTRGFRGQRRARQGIHPRGRHHPGRAVAAVLGEDESVAADDLPRVAFGQSLAVHVSYCTAKGDFTLVGASPEVHVRCLRWHAWRSGPLPARVRAAKLSNAISNWRKELLADPKERAEHLMLVDLARNDIGSVCEFGSVHVPEFMVIERYSHVMHIVSHVTGRLQKESFAVDDSGHRQLRFVHLQPRAISGRAGRGVAGASQRPDHRGARSAR